jgi:uncharacterized damage-inducible protein DinB
MIETTFSATETLCTYGANLLGQAVALIDRLEKEAKPDFDYSKAVGPHLRHVIDHYDALLRAIPSGNPVEYDHRARDQLLQSQPAVARRKLESIIQSLRDLGAGVPKSFEPTTPMTTIFNSGAEGEYEFETGSTLGRELIFVSHHAVHHYAILSKYCAEAGVVVDANFGKAPATIAYEKTLPPKCA